jgi:PHD/YefM family antitoxin component YafN of YafNO toxin-antitoxin module
MPAIEVMKNLPDILKTIEGEDSMFTITRNGKAVDILITPEKYDALLETIEILGDKEIMTALEASRIDFENGDVFSHQEVWQES